MRFVHLADCHLGSWRLPELQQLNLRAFERAIDTCIEKKVDFILITGDLFDSAMPSVDILKAAAAKLKQLADSDIACYVIPGSHDYSASGKTFLDVLEKAGLCINVAKYTETERGVELELLEQGSLLIGGLPCKKAGLEKELFEKIIVKEKGSKDKFKILALHTTLTEHKPNMSSSIDAAKLPVGFDYYALGHIHKPFKKSIGDGLLVYPGTLFPNNFAELEELGCGSFSIVNVDDNINVQQLELKLKAVFSLVIDASNKSPPQVTEEIAKKLSKVKDKIVTLRVSGQLASGKASDINFEKINSQAEQAGCVLLKNIAELSSREFSTQIEVESGNIDDVEQEIVKKHAKEHEEFSSELILKLLHALDTEKQEGETASTFEQRLEDSLSKILEIK